MDCSAGRLAGDVSIGGRKAAVRLVEGIFQCNYPCLEELKLPVTVNIVLTADVKARLLVDCWLVPSDVLVRRVTNILARLVTDCWTRLVTDVVGRVDVFIRLVTNLLLLDFWSGVISRLLTVIKTRVLEEVVDFRIVRADV